MREMSQGYTKHPVPHVQLDLLQVFVPAIESWRMPTGDRDASGFDGVP